MARAIGMDFGVQDNLRNIDIRIAQAERLKERIVGASIFVESVILYIAAMLMLGDYVLNAVIWLTLSTIMVAITYIYAKFRARGGITRENVDNYLFGHVILSSFTGFVWGGLAIYFVDWDSAFSLFIASSIVCTIVLAGMMPGATYRPGFIGLATCMLIPFGIYILIYAQGPFQLAGFGVILLYVFGMISSMQAQRNSNDGIAARQFQELNSKIRTQNDIIRQANAEKTRFLAATSHDFSQPLHAQGYFIQALSKKVKGAEQVDLLKKIEASWKHQKRLLQGLVEINQLDSGTIVPKLKPVNVKATLKSMLDDFEVVADDSGIRFTSDLCEASVQTDPLLLTRIVQNLLSNSFRYTPSGGEVQLVSKTNDEIVEIRVVDNGPGIPDDQQSRIFDEYVQLENTASEGQRSGLGLGLSIVKRLSELLNIDLNLESELGRGTIFSLVLPVYTGPMPETVINNGNDQIQEQKLIVLVDDEEIILQSMSTMISGWGYDLLVASDPDDALNQLAEIEANPDLLIIDKRLGHGRNGIDLIGALREETNSDIPAILMSGDLTTKVSDIPLARVRFMGKPIEPDDLHDVMTEMTEQIPAEPDISD
jgi:signal transduction histidine kinase/CheY-like chemotaxis protein